MKIGMRYVIFLMIISLMLGGCLDVTGTRVSIDLKEHRGEVVYLDIISGEVSEEDVKKDLRDLLDMAYEQKGDTVVATVVSTELYEDEGVLNARRAFVVKDMEKLLDEYDIERDYRGYVMTIGDDNADYVGGNGIYMESSAGRQVIWDKDVSVIEAEISYELRDSEVTGMLPYWKKWKKWDAAEGPDAASLLSQEFGDAIKHLREDNTIDYCPNGTCHSFTARLRSPGSYNRLSDFVYIYLLHISDDASVEGFKTSGEKYAAEIVARNMQECPGENELQNAKCALRNIKDIYSITLTAITYGEEESQEAPVDLSEVLD